jgi:5S rRNA maturation endonuclease (ribonuclease M5)
MQTSANCGSGCTTGTNFLSKHVRVSASFRCPVCGHDDWCCVAKDGTYAYCNRVESPRNYGDKGWLHVLDTSCPLFVPETTAVPKLDNETVSRYVGMFVANGKRWNAVDHLASQLGVAPWALRGLSAGWNEKSQCFTFAMRDSFQDFCGVRYRFPDGRKRSLKGSNEGLFYSPSTLCRKSWFICEGPTDTAALMTMGLGGVGRPNCTGGLDKLVELALLHRPRCVAIIADRDAEGSKAERFTRLGFTSLLKSLERHAIPTRIIAPKNHKDVRQYLLTGGNAQGILRALTAGRSDHWIIHA